MNLLRRICSKLRRQCRDPDVAELYMRATVALACGLLVGRSYGLAKRRTRAPFQARVTYDHFSEGCWDECTFRRISN